MTPPTGSEQVLSLAWALEEVAGFSHGDAVQAICDVFGIEIALWERSVEDNSWFIGDRSWLSRGRGNVEAIWNERFARVTNVWLDEDAWHSPLWQLWLKNSRMVLAANLSYLIRSAGRGTVAKLAEFTDRDRTTVSKWGRWKEEGRNVRVPPMTLMPKLLEFFELKPSLNLSQVPLFLGRAAIHDVLLRIQGKHYLDCLSGEHLSHAVDRLREESARQAVKKLNR